MPKRKQIADAPGIQFYKQGPGASDDDGGAMEPGWYWVRTRESPDPSLPPIPYGRSTGPFKSKREAEQSYADYRKVGPTLLSLRFPVGGLSFHINVEGDPIELVKTALQRVQRKGSRS